MSYHTHSPSTVLYQTATSLIVQALATVHIVQILTVQALFFIRMLPHSLFKYRHSSDYYRTHHPNTGLSDCNRTHSPSTDLYLVTTLIVQALSFITLLPRSLCKYWHLSDCYSTYCPKTGICPIVSTLIVQLLESITTLIVQVLTFI